MSGDYLFKDIYKFERLKNPEILRRLLKAIALQVGNLVSVPELANLIRVSSVTVERYLDLLENELKPLIPQGLAAAIYTQTTDVEIEINGYLTYDRQVEKINRDVLKRAHKRLIDG